MSSKLTGKELNCMNIYLNDISGIPDAILTMYMSKRTWTPEINEDVVTTCGRVFNHQGKFISFALEEDRSKVDNWLAKLFKWGNKHITMLRFVDMCFTVEGLHRGAQDDFDSHARRLDNRIVRSSTRLATFGTEKSDFYQGKIVTTDEVLDLLHMELPDRIDIAGKPYVKMENGYIEEEFVNNKDVMRGLYMLSIPSNFIFKCNFTEWSHIVMERDCNSHAAPELQEMVEKICLELQNIFPQLTKEYWYSFRN